MAVEYSTMSSNWRNIFLITVSALLLVAFASAEIVPSRSCDEDSEDDSELPKRNCTVLELRVTPCPEAAEGEECKIKKGETVSLSFDFTPLYAGSEIQARAYWTNELVDLPLLGMETNACNFTSCPLKPNEKHTYTYSLQISKLFPTRSYNVKWKLWDEPKNEMECCFIMPIKLVK